MDQIVEKEVITDKEVKEYRVDVNVSEEFLESPDDKIIIAMKPLKDDEGVATQLAFGSNHQLVDKDLNVAVEHFQHWLKEGLDNNVIIAKLQELDRMQYAQNIPCNEIGTSLARLYDQYLSQ